MSKKCIHYHVYGRVQGVWFRANTQRTAREFNLTGWVKNRNDGSVEVIACGEEDDLNQFETWLWQGPENAKVDEVSCDDIDWQDFKEFEIW